MRNPDFYIKECLEVGVRNIAWDRGYLVKRSIDPDKFMNVWAPPSYHYRYLVLGDSEQGAIEVDQDTTMARPRRVHPLWEYGDPIAMLEDYLADGDPDEMVVVTRTPISYTTIGRQFFRLLADLQAEYPERKVHVHGLYSYRLMFGVGFRSADVDPRTGAKKGKVYLPNGKEVTYEKAAETPHWVTCLGFSPVDLKVPRNRCMYNIRSAQWAAEYFTVNQKFAHERSHTPGDPDRGTPATSNVIQVHRTTEKLGDKFLCGVCSLQNTCKYFREGAVCSVPGSEPTELSRYFKTRDSDQIIEGLGSLLAVQTERLDEARKREIEDDKVDPEVTKIINTLFDRGVKLAKLVNPALVSPSVSLKFTQNNATITASSPQAMMAAVMKELEAAGVPRDKVTPEMVEAVLAASTGREQAAIDVASAERAG